MCRFLVGFQAGPLGKALPTQGTLIGFLATVNHRVSDEVALLGETPAALETTEGLLARVASQVLFELAEPHEALCAVRAAEPLLPNARSPRRPHPPAQAESTTISGVW